jgi:hypothetical protein
MYKDHMQHQKPSRFTTASLAAAPLDVKFLEMFSDLSQDG